MVRFRTLILSKLIIFKVAQYFGTTNPRLLNLLVHWFWWLGFFFVRLFWYSIDKGQDRKNIGGNIIVCVYKSTLCWFPGLVVKVVHYKFQIWISRFHLHLILYLLLIRTKKEYILHKFKALLCRPKIKIKKRRRTTS